MTMSRRERPDGAGVGVGAARGVGGDVEREGGPAAGQRPGWTVGRASVLSPAPETAECTPEHVNQRIRQILGQLEQGHAGRAIGSLRALRDCCGRGEADDAGDGAGAAGAAAAQAAGGGA